MKLIHKQRIEALEDLINELYNVQGLIQNEHFDEALEELENQTGTITTILKGDFE